MGLNQGQGESSVPELTHAEVLSRTWKRNDMGTLSISLALWDGNPSLTDGFTHRRPVVPSFESSHVISPNQNRGEKIRYVDDLSCGATVMIFFEWLNTKISPKVRHIRA